MKKGLGRGLNSLFGDYAQYDVEEKKPEEKPVEEKIVEKPVETVIQTETKPVKTVKKVDAQENGVCEIDISLIDICRIFR